MDEILQALSNLRVPMGQWEIDIHTQVAKVLDQHGLDACHEVNLGPRKRIDFMIGTVGIEIKRGRPNPSRLLPQIEKYLECDALSALILVVEKNASIPDRVLGKPVRLISLNRLWGISL